MTIKQWWGYHKRAIKRKVKLTLFFIDIFAIAMIWQCVLTIKATPVLAEEVKVQFLKKSEEQIKIEGVKEIIKTIATLYGQDPKKALIVAQCESQFIPDKIGDNGTSYGLWQFHLHAHPEVSKECILDPVCSTFQAMAHWKKGQQNLWTCYNMNF